MGETIIYSLLGTKHIPFQGSFEDEFPFPKVGYVNSLEGNHHLHPVFFLEEANFGTPQNPTTKTDLGAPNVPEAVALMASSSKWQEGIECCREFGSPKGEEIGGPNLGPAIFRFFFFVVVVG